MIFKNNKGVTLIELMIVMVIAAVLVAGIYSLFMTQQRSYFVQDQVSGVQQDARVALDIMARDIRMAGVMIGGQGFNVNGFTFAVTPDNGSVSTGGTPATSPDRITVVGAADQFMSGANPVKVTIVNNNVVTLSEDVGSFFDTDTNNFVSFEGDAMYALYQITVIDTDTLTLNPTPPANLATILDVDATVSPPVSTVVGARVYRAKAITYTVTAPDGTPGLGVLRRNENTGDGAQPMAGDGTTTFVEDLQFAYQVAGDTTNWYNTPVEAGATNAAIRMVRISLVVRTAVPDPEDTTFNQPSLEDHTGSLAGPDGFRRRVYATVVKVRNL